MGVIAEARGKVLADIARSNAVASRVHPTDKRWGKLAWRT